MANPEAGPPLLELRAVRKIYGQGESMVHALAGVDLIIREGEFVAAMGPSGSGKSTCMNILGCLDRPSLGSYLFRGIDATKLSLDQLALLRRYYLGFVFQGFNLLARTSALENVELPLIYRRMPARERRVRALRALHDVGLSGREHHTPAELSGGQQQRVAIARAIVSEPSLLLADEPTGALDPHTATGVLRLLRDAADGTTVIIVTHDPQVTRFCDQAVFLYAGRVDGVVRDPEPTVVAGLIARLGEQAEQASLGGGRG